MEEMKSAMKAKDSVALESLRAIKSAILLAQTEKKAGTGLTEEEEIKLVQKLVKQRKDSAAIYTEQGRDDLAEPELAQAAVIERFLAGTTFGRRDRKGGGDDHTGYRRQRHEGYGEGHGNGEQATGRKSGWEDHFGYRETETQPLIALVRKIRPNVAFYLGANWDFSVICGPLQKEGPSGF